MKILVVDDELEVADVIAESLKASGHDVEVAGSGEDALCIIQRSWPEAVFLDVAMPGLNGIDVLSWIRQTHPALPVVIVSGWATDTEIEEARRLGVTDVVQKPVALKHFAEALARIR